MWSITTEGWVGVPQKGTAEMQRREGRGGGGRGKRALPRHWLIVCYIFKKWPTLVSLKWVASLMSWHQCCKIDKWNLLPIKHALYISGKQTLSLEMSKQQETTVPFELPSVASKCGHKTKKHVLIGCQTWRVLSPNIRTVASDQRVPLISFFNFSQLAGIFLSQKQHTCLQKVFFPSKNACKEYFVEQKQIKSTTAAYSKLWMFGAKTCHVCTQLEHVFPSHVHA